MAPPAFSNKDPAPAIKPNGAGSDKLDVTPLPSSSQAKAASPTSAHNAPAPTRQPHAPKKRGKMASTFGSLIAGAKRIAIGTREAAPSEQLFKKVDPEVDGEECLHDCSSCSVHYPRGFKVEEADELYGMVKGWQTHILVATGKTDWVRDVADEKGSVMEAVDKAHAPSNGVSLLVCEGEWKG